MSRTSWSPGRVQFSHADRRTILHRDPLCTWNCGRPSTIADHITPIAEGGTNTVDNGQGMCDPCHQLKTQQERTRGLHRRPNRCRPVEPHPGLVN